ncbi:DnaJ-class molecular chaperone with C-terminal Zn finger domain [Xenococcus sp. PCC 7305]|uniref:CPP1-like family protein n=1 Tax=Xenococcus sp. PCC 7305 TaxID=102125 RepID=UPI0002ACEF9E|nr:CPP1-like family protein [Xenococcus sp. PCC 7305]ELS04949.1 DnaJ-class molecular chaperone with C-terminal Zn finger domain [Xenococcus sp. PCC 7305]
MSQENPYELLGVSDNASFDEIQSAKKRICEENKNDAQIVEKVEAAYDAVIMERLKLRQDGKIKVPERIRFPERNKVETPTPNQVPTLNSPNWMQNLIDNPSQNEILLPTGVFLALAVLSFFAGNAQGSPLTLFMALGFTANVYFLTRKENRFGRSLLITIIAFVLGIGLGAAISASLANSGITLNPDQAEETNASFAFLLFWITSCFLR